MPDSPLVVLLAFTALVVVATALFREVSVLRVRRDVDQYLQWLMADAVGPLSPAPPPRWY
jgi:hypothetical protein